MKFSLPSKYVPTPAWVIVSAFDARPEKRALLGNYNRLLSLSWNRKDKSTPIMREEDCYEFLGLKRRQLFEIIKEMEGMRWLRSERPRPGFVQFFFHGDDPATAVSKITECEITHPDAKNRTTDPIVVVVKESTDSELIQETTTILNGEASAKNRTDGNEPASQLPTASQILAQTPLLFNGAVVMSQGLEYHDPLDVLRWCAYVYSQRRTMTAPGGVVRNNLKWKKAPPAWTAEKWFETLPNNFLEALGLKSPEADDDQPEERPEPVYFEEPAFATPLPVGSRLVTSGRVDVATVAWQATKAQLQLQMARNPFELWVQDTQAVRYDGNALTIGVVNEATQAWLESRLTSTVERLLIGILNAEVEVKFVVAELAELAEVESE